VWRCLVHPAWTINYMRWFLLAVQVGQKGVTSTVLTSIVDALAGRQYVRVRLGEGCGLDRDATAAALGRLADAAVLQCVGFTVTLYRATGLPRPSNCPVSKTTMPSPMTAASLRGSSRDAASAGKAATASAGAQKVRLEGSSKGPGAQKGARQAAGNKSGGDAQGVNQKQGEPQEFQVLPRTFS
jgi:RNA-binding protein YhbY